MKILSSNKGSVMTMISICIILIALLFVVNMTIQEEIEGISSVAPSPGPIVEQGQKEALSDRAFEVESESVKTDILGRKVKKIQTRRDMDLSERSGKERVYEMPADTKVLLQ